MQVTPAEAAAAAVIITSDGRADSKPDDLHGLRYPCGPAPDAGCAIFTTSGTTKAPKFVLHDQRTVIRHAFDVAKGFSIDAGATLLLAPPLCGVFGFCIAMGSFAASRPMVIAPAWDAERAASLSHTEKTIGTDDLP